MIQPHGGKLINRVIRGEEKRKAAEFSGTGMREKLLKGEKPSAEVMRPEVVEAILK